MKLERTTLKDQGSISRRSQRHLKRSHITLLSAVELVIDGNAPQVPKESALAQRAHHQALAPEEKARRQEPQKKCEELSDENRDKVPGSRLRCETETIDWARGLLVLNLKKMALALLHEDF